MNKELRKGSILLLGFLLVALSITEPAIARANKTGKAPQYAPLTGECPEGRSDLVCRSEIPPKEEVLELVKNSFENWEDINIWDLINESDGCRFAYSYKVMIVGMDGETEICRITYEGTDNIPPTPKAGAELPQGRTDLESPDEAPDPNSFIYKIRDGHEDNCGKPAKARFLYEELEYVDCGVFTVTQHFEVSDRCGNTTPFQIIHSGEVADPPPLTGECPEGMSGLTCRSEVPSKEEILALIEQSYENWKEITVWDLIKESDGCRFAISFKVMINGFCGESEICRITFEGEDNVPPAPRPDAILPVGETDLESPEAAPDPNSYIFRIRNAYEDNCGKPANARFVREELEAFECDFFTLTQYFEVFDRCGNVTPFEIVHSGAVGAPSLTGECPEGKSGLETVNEVPFQSEVEELVKASFQNWKEVQVQDAEEERDGSEFKFTFEAVITGFCGEVEVCQIVYEGSEISTPSLLGNRTPEEIKGGFLIEVSPPLTLELHPNPSFGEINLELGGLESERALIRIYSISGEVVFQSFSNNVTSMNIDLSGMRLPGGAYFVSVTSGYQTLTRKLFLSN